MKYGITGCLDRLSLLKTIGFDFVEPGASTVFKMSDEEFSSLQQSLLTHQIPALAFNLFFPSDIKSTGPLVDFHVISEYLHKCLNRCKKLGGKVIVYGSGGSRKVPDGFEYDEAWQQLVTFFQFAGEIASLYDIIIVVEPLYKKNTNIINSVAEGLELCKQVNHPNIRLLADSFHMIHENEDPKIILEAGIEYLHHIHIRDEEEGFPLEKDRPYFDRFLSALKQIGYDGTISYEVSIKKLSPEEFQIQAYDSLKMIKGLVEKQIN